MKHSVILGLVILGAVILVGAAILLLSGNAGGSLQTRTVDITGQFNNISIRTKTADVTFLPTDGDAKVVLHDRERMAHYAVIQGDTLTIGMNDTRKWYEHLSISFWQTPSVTVYLPRERYANVAATISTGSIALPAGFTFDSVSLSATTGDVAYKSRCMGQVTIAVSTGSIAVEGITANSLNLSATTGSISVISATCGGEITAETSTGSCRLTDISCLSLTGKGTTGSLSLKNVLAQNDLLLTTSTGNIRFDSCDAGQINASASTGDITGSVRTQKIFYTHTSTGKIEVPDTHSGGKCELSTSTGNIRVTLG